MDNLYDISSKFLGKERESSKATVTSTLTSSLDKYWEMMKTGEYVQMTFERADADGTLSKVLDNVLIQMKAEEITGEAYDLRFKSQKLADAYYVRVLDIDESSRTVWVSHNASRTDKRPELEKEINERLEKSKDAILVKGKVLRIQAKTINGETIDTGVWLDLCGVGILGFVYIGDWAHTYTAALRGDTKYGDIIEVCIKEKKTRLQRNNEVTYYTCSRKELTKNPWEEKTLEEKYHEGDIVRIKCLSLREGNWFGKINGLEGIQVFAEYPSTIHKFPIIPGMEYMGKIYHLNVRERSLKVRVFQALTLEGYSDLEEPTHVSEESGGK